MTAMTSAGGGWPSPSSPAEDTVAGMPRAASRADSIAYAITDRQTLPVQSKGSQTSDVFNYHTCLLVYDKQAVSPVTVDGRRGSERLGRSVRTIGDRRKSGGI
jgi:hypothetical protein